MNESTRRLTTGAMFTALFAIILLINRQTGGMAEEFIMYLLPIPMVGYASKYGWKPGLVVLAAMSLISIFFSTPTAIFYAVTEAFIGLVLGTGVYKKWDMTKVLLAVMGLSSFVNVLNTIVLTSLFGNDLDSQITEMQTLLTESLKQAGANETVISQFNAAFTPDLLLKMLVISMILFGLLQGFLVFELSLLILRRLRFTVPQPKSVFLYTPPMWSGIIAMVLFLTYNFSGSLNLTGIFKSILQVSGICAYLYLCCWGFLAVMLFFKKPNSKNLFLQAAIAFVLLMIMPILEALFGYVYLIPQYHEQLLNRAGMSLNNTAKH